MPLDLRLELYEEDLRLRNEYLGYGKIISEIKERYKVTLAKGTISGWVAGTSTPFKAGHVFYPNPTPELAYAIGVKTGDASLNVKAKTYQYEEFDYKLLTVNSSRHSINLWPKSWDAPPIACGRVIRPEKPMWNLVATCYISSSKSPSKILHHS